MAAVLSRFQARATDKTIALWRWRSAAVLALARAPTDETSDTCPADDTGDLPSGGGGGSGCFGSESVAGANEGGEDGMEALKREVATAKAMAATARSEAQTLTREHAEVLEESRCVAGGARHVRWRASAWLYGKPCLRL